MSFVWKNITKYTYGIDTFQLAQAALLFALTYNSDLPWWKWFLFILNYAGFTARYKKTITSTNDQKEENKEDA